MITENGATWTYLGYQCFDHWGSHSCPRLKLYGYATPRRLEAAIRKSVKRIRKGLIT